MLDKLLICNRGEIAVRVLRACRELGIPTVIAHSTADRDSLAVQLADEAFCIGPGPAARSYLNVPAILYACARTGATAVHPGYGFLSEDADFAEACESVGLTFVGPSSAVIRLMGDKIAARSAMARIGVPCAAGTANPVSDVDAATAAAAECGYPVVIKAAAGGGGRGMKVVTGPEALPAAFTTLRHEARAMFVDDRVYVERYIERARHVEVQVLADRHGNVVHLGERDCSIQRRHQKLLEESPCPSISEEVRQRLCGAAVRAAATIGYTSAGTVEFLLDDRGDFFFLEMNTRIQVEHPVTELRTGIDLVGWMLRIAAGERLSFTQEEIRPVGHAVECRINAEDPEHGWAGSAGHITELRLPGGTGVRVDTHAYPGYRMPPYYDSLLAKLTVHAADRESALHRMDRALRELVCTGVTTTAGFHRDLVRHPVFRNDDHRLDFVERYLDAGGRLRTDTPEPAPLQEEQ